MDTCPVCGEKAVTEDTENGQTVRVCTECGAVDSDMQELTSTNTFEGTSLSDGKGYAPKGRKNWMQTKSSTAETNKMLGKKLITNIGLQLKAGKEIMEEACYLYDRVYDNDLHHSAGDNKKAMCLACLYACARKHRFSINIREIGFFLNINKSAYRFGAALKCLKYKYDVHLPPIDIENESNRILSQSDLSRDVVKLTQQILLVMQRAMVTTGRCCMSYTVPCAYYAYKASDVVKNGKISFKAFCNRFNFRRTLRYACRPEVEKTLKAMARELPWIKGLGVEVDRVEIYIKDIIKYQLSLFGQAVLSAVSELDEVNKVNRELTEVDPDLIKDPGFIFRQCAKRKQEEESSEKEDRETEKKLKVKSKKSARQDHDNQTGGNSSGLESFDLGSDDDTDLYILSSKEVMMKKEVSEHLGVEFDDTVYIDVDGDDQNLADTGKCDGVKEKHTNVTNDSAPDKNDNEDANDDDDDEDEDNYDNDYDDNDDLNMENYLTRRFRYQTEGEGELESAYSDEDDYYD